jgi:hypothetical protein
VTTSTVLGFGYAGAGVYAGLPIDTCLLAGGLCGVGGMLPDLDSASGIPQREAMSFAAAVIPMFLVERFQTHHHLSHEHLVLIAAGLYLFIRFGVGEMLKRYTVHRGMFHSIPAAILFAELAFLICGCHDIRLRYYKAGAVFLGVMSHLVLDEIYAVDWTGARLKKSFGTAIKFWGDSLWGNLSMYGKLIIATALVMNDPTLVKEFGPPAGRGVYQTADKVIEDVLR